MRKRLMGILLGAVSAGPVAAATFTVDTTSDNDLRACTAAANDCSLRGALALANGTSQAVHRVEFNIPMTDAGCVAATGVCTIRPQTRLPDINANLEGAVTIDGYTQPGAAPNTRPVGQGLDTQIKIEIDGSQCGGASGCTGISFIRVGTVRGLAIGGFAVGGSPVGLTFGLGTGAVVEGNFLGTDATGRVARPNGYGVILGNTAGCRIGGTQPAQRNLISGNRLEGVIVNGSGHAIEGNLIGTDVTGTAALPNLRGLELVFNQGVRVGGLAPGTRNVISGNLEWGIRLRGLGGQGIRIVDNLIGTDVSGTLPLGNGLVGIELSINVFSGQPAIVGGLEPGAGNVIAFNGTSGVALRNQGGAVLGNRFRDNGLLALSAFTGDNGFATQRQPNDAGDADPGSNFGQNFPEISAYAVNGGAVQLTYRVDSTTTASTYPLRIEFYKARGDEGEVFIGSDTYLAAEARTDKTISLSIPAGVTLGADDVIVATATDANGNTSEFSFHPLALSVVSTTPNPSPSGTAYAVRVRAVASAGPFRPNGVVRVADGAGGNCLLALAPVAAPRTSEGECSLSTAGAPRTITLTATYDTFSGAFGSANGTNVTTTGSHAIAAPPPERVSFRTCVQSESERGGTATLVVTRQGAADVSVRVEHLGGTATLGADYSPPPDATLTWTGSDMSPRSVVVQLVDDAAEEAAIETARFRLVNPVGTEIAPIAVAEVRIRDDDVEPDVLLRDGFEGPGCPQ